MPYQFVTSCAICAKRFGVLWVMDPIQVGTKNVATDNLPALQEADSTKMPRNFFQSGLRYRTWSLVAPCGAWK